MKQWKYFNEAEYIHNGTYSEPQLKYKGKIFNYFLIEDTIFARFQEFAEENNVEQNEENFTTYCKENQDEIRELFEIED
jgi:hypothetical protein